MLAKLQIVSQEFPLSLFVLNTYHVLYVNMTNGCIHVRTLEKKTLHTKQRNINVVDDNQINIHTKLVSINPVISEQNIQNGKISDDNAQPCGSGVSSVAYD